MYVEILVRRKYNKSKFIITIKTFLKSKLELIM